jgi:2-keto-4-pentenoate hydratase
MALRGQPLKAGELVLSGALGPMVPAAAGDWVQVRIDTVGECAVRFD